jgi:predicted acyltransferase
VDPEGILSTLGAIATTILGLLAGAWLRAATKTNVLQMLGAGLLLVAIGSLWGLVFSLNKSLWTGSYVLCTAGLATLFLASLHWTIDIKGWRRWATPFVIFGTNAIALYVGSSLFGMTLDIVEVDLGDTTQTLKERIFTSWFLPHLDALNASLLYAIAFLLVWLAIIGMLYRKRIFLKV